MNQERPRLAQAGLALASTPSPAAGEPALPKDMGDTLSPPPWLLMMSALLYVFWDSRKGDVLRVFHHINLPLQTKGI